MARVLDFIFVLYFVSHIPATIFIDSQAIFPQWWYPKVCRDLLTWYGREFKDVMMLAPPAWFKSFVYCEMTVQFPFFFVAAYAFYKGGCNWIRLPGMVYGSHVSTTVLAILWHIWFNDFTNSMPAGPETTEEKLRLSAVYFPYFIVPLLLLFKCWFGMGDQEGEKQKYH